MGIVGRMRAMLRWRGYSGGRDAAGERGDVKTP